MPQDEITPAKSSHSFLYRVVRAVIIGILSYYLLGLLFMFYQMDLMTVIHHFEDISNNRHGDDKPFVAWNGKAPTTAADLQLKVGYEWAKANNVRSHAACRERWKFKNSLAENGGCSIYVTKVNVTDEIRKLPPMKKHKGWDDGTTTAECITERETRWNLILKDMRERGDDYAATVTFRKQAGPDISECQNFDNIRIGRVIFEPQTRLTEMLRRARNGGLLSEEDRHTLQKDYPGVESYPTGHSNYREKYLADAEELFKIAGGKEYVLGQTNVANIPDLETLNNSVMSCEEYRTKIEAFKTRDAEIAAKETQYSPSSPEWQTLNQARVQNMNAWGMMTGDAKAANCLN